MELIEITSKILDILGIFWEEELGTARNKVSYGDLIMYLVEESSYENRPDKLRLSLKTLERILVILRGRLNKPPKFSWDTYLLLYLDLGKCTRCNTIKPLKDMVTTKGFLCKSCDSLAYSTYAKKVGSSVIKEKSRKHYYSNKDAYIARNAIKRDRIRQATPNWANLVEIQRFYLNRPEGYHVDHIVPLNGNNVCGLHVIENLQYLSAFDNISKGNKFNG